MVQGVLSIISSKDAKEVGNREHHTHNGICVAFHLRFAEKDWRVFISSSFPIRFFLNWSIEMKGRVSITQSSKAAGKTIRKQGMTTKSKSSATRATRESTNSTLITWDQSNNSLSRGTLLLARLLCRILVSSSDLVTLITQEYMTLQSVLRTLRSILSMQVLLPLQLPWLSIVTCYITCYIRCIVMLRNNGGM